MLNLLKSLRQDEHGVILSAEIVIIGSLLVVGLITGVSCLQRSVDGELRDVGNAIGSLDQSFAFAGHYKPPTNGRCCAWTAGSSYHNCEAGNDACCQDGIISVGEGCQSVARAVGCGQCGGNGCSSCGHSARGAVSCGGCGSGLCGGGCGISAGTTGARCIQSGVKNMKITEWPSASVYAIPGRINPVPEGSVQVFGASQSAACCESISAPGSGDLVIPDHVW